jgi:hypothetical protein
MRFVVCFFGLIACLLTASGGGAFIAWDAAAAWIKENIPQNWLEELKIDVTASVSMTGVSHANAGLVLIIAAAYGFLGSILVLFRCGKQGGSLMLIPVLGAAFMDPYSLLFTAFQAFVALLSFFIGPLPLNPPQEKDDTDDDEDDD